MKTKSVPQSEAKRRWFLVDAEGKVLGRAASEIAKVLRGKHKVEYTPNADHGDFVVVINAEKVVLTGKKEERKLYHKHTGWIGSVSVRTAGQIRETKPEQLIKDAVWGMLPHNINGRHMYSKLKVYVGAEHPHAAQKPENLAL